MRKLSIEDFKSIMLAGVWSHDVNVETVDTQHHEEHIYTTDGDIAETRHSEYVHGYGNVVSTCEDITLTYEEQWSFTKYDKDSFDADDGCWTLDGAVVVDEDGDEVAIDWVIEDTDDLDYDFTYIDYSELEITETKDIDVQASDVDRTMTIECDNGPTIRFTGDRIAAAASSDNNASGSSYSGSTGLWTELSLYKTDKDNYICHKVERTRWQGSKDYSSLEICDSLEAVIQFFGHDWLAKDLYENGEIEAIIYVDDEEVTMGDNTITLRVDNKPDLRFEGECIGSASSSDNNASGSSYSGSTGRWTELKLYKTKGGRYVCHQIGYTRWQGERDLYKAKVCETTEEVIEFFGHRWLAKELYENAGIEDVTQID